MTALLTPSKSLILRKYSVQYLDRRTIIGSASSFSFTNCNFGAGRGAREIFTLISARVPGTRNYGTITIGGTNATKGSLTNSTQSQLVCAFAHIPEGDSGTIIVPITGGNADACTVFWFSVLQRPGFGQPELYFNDSSGSGNIMNIATTWYKKSFVLSTVYLGTSASAASIVVSGAGVNYLGYENESDRKIGGALSDIHTEDGAGNVTWDWSNNTANRGGVWVYG